MNSLATTCWSTYGPEVPNGVIATLTADSPACATSSSHDQPSVRSVSTRSALAISPHISASPRSTDRLSAARYPNKAPGAPPADHNRTGSPCGGSILTTSAPASTNILPQYDAAMPLDSSTTRHSSSGAISSVAESRRPAGHPGGRDGARRGLPLPRECRHACPRVTIALAGLVPHMCDDVDIGCLPAPKASARLFPR